MAEGQRLRWWQEEEAQTHAAKEAAERVTPTSAPLLPDASATAAEAETDTWAELESEAVRRAEQAKIEASESVSFFINKPAVLARHRFWARFNQAFLGVYVASFLGLFGLFGWLAIMQWTVLHRLNLVEFLVPLLWAASGLPFWLSTPSKVQYPRLLEKESPVLRLTPQGIIIAKPLRKDEFFRWNTLAGVKACRLLKHRYLEIKTTKGRIITVEQQDLTATVDTIADQIDAYRTARDIA